MAKSKLNAIGLVFACLALVGLILAIVGMVTGIVSVEGGESSTLFDDGWGEHGMPSTAFTVVAFVVTLIGAVAVLAYVVLNFVGKDIKLIGLCGGAVAVIGGILVLVAGLVLAGDVSDIVNAIGNGLGSLGVQTTKIGVYAGVGIWLGMIGGLVSGASGILSALKIGQK